MPMNKSLQVRGKTICFAPLLCAILLNILLFFINFIENKTVHLQRFQNFQSSLCNVFFISLGSFKTRNSSKNETFFRQYRIRDIKID